jgi:hypothetical protein
MTGAKPLRTTLHQRLQFVAYAGDLLWFVIGEHHGAQKAPVRRQRTIVFSMG